MSWGGYFWATESFFSVDFGSTFHGHFCTLSTFPIHQAFLSNRGISFSETSSQPDAFNPLHSREAKQPWILSGSTRLPLPLSPPFLPRTFFLVSGQTLPSSSSSDLAALSSTSFRSPGLSICFHPLSSSAAALLAFISSPEHRGRERERAGENIIRGGLLFNLKITMHCFPVKGKGIKWTA